MMALRVASSVSNRNATLLIVPVYLLKFLAHYFQCNIGAKRLIYVDLVDSANKLGPKQRDAGLSGRGLAQALRIRS